MLTNTKGLHANKINILVYGNSGTGKTSLIGTGDESDTLIVSIESGLLCLSDKEIDVVEVNEWNDFNKAYSFLTSEEVSKKYKTIAIDSLTELSDLLVRTLETMPEYQDPKNAFKMWGEYNKRISKLIKTFRDLDKNVIFTALPEDVSDGGLIIKKPYIKGKETQRLLESYFDEVFYIQIDPNSGERQILTQPTSNISAKDRSGKLEAIEEPNLINIFSKIKGS